MFDGPMDCHVAGGSAAAEAAALALRAVFLRALLPPLRPGEASAMAAFANAAAKGLAAGAALPPRRPRAGRAVLARGRFERIAFLVSPKAGRAALGTASVATTSSLSVGSRSPR